MVYNFLFKTNEHFSIGLLVLLNVLLKCLCLLQGSIFFCIQYLYVPFFFFCIAPFVFLTVWTTVWTISAHTYYVKYSPFETLTWKLGLEFTNLVVSSKELRWKIDHPSSYCHLTSKHIHPITLVSSLRQMCGHVCWLWESGLFREYRLIVTVSFPICNLKSAANCRTPKKYVHSETAKEKRFITLKIYILLRY